jgi:hypothetical protein
MVLTFSSVLNPHQERQRVKKLSDSRKPLQKSGRNSLERPQAAGVAESVTAFKQDCAAILRRFKSNFRKQHD